MSTASGDAWQLAQIQGTDHARQLLDAARCLLAPIRRLLAHEEDFTVGRLDDRHALDLAAAKLARGEWVLLKRIQPHTDRVYPLNAPAPKMTPPPAVDAVPPRSMRSPNSANHMPEPAPFRADSRATAPQAVAHWIEVELVGEDGKPIPNEPFQLELPDGQQIIGQLDTKGFTRVNDIPVSGLCRLNFPRLDGQAWQAVHAQSARPPAST